MQAGGQEFESLHLHSLLRRSGMYLENRILYILTNADRKKFLSTQEIGKRHPRTSTKVDELKERKLLKTNLKTHKS